MALTCDLPLIGFNKLIKKSAMLLLFSMRSRQSSLSESKLLLPEVTEEEISAFWERMRYRLGYSDDRKYTNEGINFL